MKRKKDPVLKHATFVDSALNIAPAKASVPKWYTDTRVPERSFEKIKHAPAKVNFKLCYPFLDTLTSGYMAYLPVDIAIEKTDTYPNITWKTESEFYPVGVRDEVNDFALPIPAGHHPKHFSWSLPNSIKVPEGYNALITHPINRYDLPFTTLSGIIEGGFAMHQGNLPVFFNENFEGVIPRGTPIFQIIPFKSENWSNEVDEELKKEASINEAIATSTIMGWYKKNHWKRKTYE